jgi:hypothetical protein
MQLGSWHKTKQDCFLGCLEASIACIGHVRIIHSLGKGLYKGHTRECGVVLEAVADYELWIWDTFFGTAGSHKDINMLQCSLVFARLVEGQTPEVTYEINRHT